MSPQTQNSSSRPQVLDAIVVGAGVAGLHAGYLLQKAGLSTLVVEARDRVGGKTLTSDRVAGITLRQELGAGWINNSTQDRIWSVVKDIGVTPIFQRAEGLVVAQDLDGSCSTFAYGSTPVYPSESDSKTCVALRDLVESITNSQTGPLHDPDQRRYLDSISFESWLHQNIKGSQRAFATGRVWTHAIIGCEPGELSALFFLDYLRTSGGLMQVRSDQKDGGQYIRIREGVSAISERMALRLAPQSLKMEATVKRVEEVAGLGLKQVTILGKDGLQVYLARQVVMSVATPVYRTITFSPPLSSRKAAYVNSTRYSSYTKYQAIFSEPFWRRYGYCGLAQSFVGPASAFRDTSVEEGDSQNYAFTCFIAGSLGRKWAALPAEERKAAMLHQLSQIFANGDDISHLFVAGLESPWMTEEHNGWGCPIPTLPPGVYNECWDSFVAPENGVHFIGNEASSMWRGYLDGAIRTAERGSAEVIATLKKEKALL